MEQAVRALRMSDTVSKTRIFADDRGLWREDRAGRQFVIEWGEITQVSGYKLDGITEVYTVVELDFEFGEYVELFADWSGFADVAASISDRLPGIPPDWLEQIEKLGPRDDPVSVWRRAN